mmetsp:Transcript_67445/g.144244  ORF Transcript_67445/g.144244 Transcript_67445/m.144244 type:complete len:104 (-) Transcript_67445:56-367(-)
MLAAEQTDVAEAEAASDLEAPVENLSTLSVKQLKQRLADAGITSTSGLTEKAELRTLALEATSHLCKGRDGLPLNLLPGSGEFSASRAKRQILVEADFVTCTQ